MLEDPLRSFKEIQDGQGTLTVVGSLQDKENTENPISEKFIGAMNYRCVFPVTIAKNLINADSPVVLQTEHKRSTIKGAFSFVKANISPLQESGFGSNYNTSSGNPTTAYAAANPKHGITT